MTHDLKTWPAYFDAVLSGRKTFEIRKDDRGFNPGDVLRLREFSTSTNEYSGRSCEMLVIYITDFAQQPGNVVMGIAPLDSHWSGSSAPLEPNRPKLCDAGGKAMTKPEPEQPGRVACACGNGEACEMQNGACVRCGWRAAAADSEHARDERGTRSRQRVGRRREQPPLRMWLVVEPVLEVPELQGWCPVSLHDDEAEAKRAAHRLGGGRKAVRAFVDFHVPKWESPTEPS